MTSKNTKAQERAARLAESRAEAKRREERRRLISIVGVVAVLIAIIVTVVVVNKIRNKVDAPVTSEHALLFGEADAPHRLVIYEDFLCPICQGFEQAGNEAFTEQVEAGNLAVEYRPFVLLDRFGPYSADSLNAFFVVQAEAGDDVAKTFHDLLFADQPAEDSDSWPGADHFVKLAVEAGAVEAEVRPGIEGKTLSDKVKAATQEAEDANVNGTPTVLLDGEQMEGFKSWEGLVEDIVDQVSE